MPKMRVYFLFFLLFVMVSSGVGWAQGVITLPQTGQTKCYDEDGTEISCFGTGQDGEWQMGVAWPEPRFSVDGDCVTDNLTGLIWAKNGNLPNGTRTWQGALDYVAALNSGAGLCGYHDWRLPNVNELESLVDTGEFDVATWLNNQGFNDVQDARYWSSTTYAGDTGVAWFVFIFGIVSYNDDKSFNFYLWPVRSGQSNGPDPSYPANVWKTGQTTSYATGDDGDLEKGVAWPSSRFTDHGDGTVTDNLAGLMWTKDANLPNGTRTWQEALDYVKALNTGTGLGGHHDWRLPNRKELFSLIDHSKYNPALPAGHPFQNVQSDYWLSTSANGGFAWVAVMYDGYVWSTFKSEDSYVWPVRSGYKARSLEISPEEGTVGTVVTIKGVGFGTTRGKLLMGSVVSKVLNWGSEEIQASLSKAISPGTYSVTVKPKTKGVLPITEANPFTIRGPEIDSGSPSSGAPGETITLSGKFFGNKKGKVYLEYEAKGVTKLKSCKVLSWEMDPKTGEGKVVFVVPKGLPLGAHPLKLVNSVGEALADFTILSP